MKKNYRIGLFGFGIVGQGLWDILQRHHNLALTIKKICVKDPGKIRPIDRRYFCYCASEIIEDPDINAVVELIDDAIAAYNIVSTSMKNGKCVVTGNKKMLAAHLPELMDIQRNTGVTLLYDASVGGSIPIIRNLEEYYDNELLQSITGILNGSSNYVLSQMFKHQMTFDKALRMAQDKGFAESDPSLDIEGYDALNKLIIVTQHAFGVYVKPEEVFCYGISRITQHDINFAREKNKKIKLLARVEVNDEALRMFVIPWMVDETKYLYAVEDEFNGVVIAGAFYEKQFMIGRGAGAHPTGSAVYSDLVALTNHYSYKFNKCLHENKLHFRNDGTIKVYARFNHENHQSMIHFDHILELHKTPEYTSVLAIVKLKELFNRSTVLHDNHVFVAGIS